MCAIKTRRPATPAWLAEQARVKRDADTRARLAVAAPVAGAEIKSKDKKAARKTEKKAEKKRDRATLAEALEALGATKSEAKARAKAIVSGKTSARASSFLTPRTVAPDLAAKPLPAGVSPEAYAAAAQELAASNTVHL